MFAVAALLILAQPFTPGRPAGGWAEYRFQAGAGTPFVTYFSSCTENGVEKTTQPGVAAARCVVRTFNEYTTNHSHGVRLRALDPSGRLACETSTIVQPNLAPGVIAAVEALYPLQPSPSSKAIAAGAYKIQVCRREIVPAGGKAEDSKAEYCSAMATLPVRAGAHLRCTLTNH